MCPNNQCLCSQSLYILFLCATYWQVSSSQWLQPALFILWPLHRLIIVTSFFILGYFCDRQTPLHMLREVFLWYCPELKNIPHDWIGARKLLEISPLCLIPFTFCISIFITISFCHFDLQQGSDKNSLGACKWGCSVFRRVGGHVVC